MSWPQGFRRRRIHFSNAHTIPGVGGVADVASDEAAVAPDEPTPDEVDKS